MLPMNATLISSTPSLVFELTFAFVCVLSIPRGCLGETALPGSREQPECSCGGPTHQIDAVMTRIGGSVELTTKSWIQTLFYDNG